MKALRVFVNNAPDQWHVATKSWKGETLAVCKNEATATLFAAAEDMLGELLRAETIISDHVNGIERTAWAEVLAGIRDAIAKAKGHGAAK